MPETKYFMIEQQKRGVKHAQKKELWKTAVRVIQTVNAMVKTLEEWSPSNNQASHMTSTMALHYWKLFISLGGNLTPTHSKVQGLYEISPVARDGIRALLKSPVLQQHPSAASTGSWSCPGAKEEQQQVCGVHTHGNAVCWSIRCWNIWQK